MKPSEYFISERKFLNNCLTRDVFFQHIIEAADEEGLWEVEDSYKTYVKEVHRVLKKKNLTKLTLNEEEELIKRKCKGDPDAFENLYIYQLPMVIHVARKYQNLGLTLNDLISEGNIGLINAIKNLKPRGYRVMSYTTHYIKNSIITAIIKYGRQVSIPATYLPEIRRIKKCIGCRLSKGEWPVSLEEVAQECKMELEALVEAKNFDYTQISMDLLRDYLQSPDDFDEMINFSFNQHIQNPYGKIDEDFYLESLKIDTLTTLDKLVEYRKPRNSSPYCHAQMQKSRKKKKENKKKSNRKNGSIKEKKNKTYIEIDIKN